MYMKHTLLIIGIGVLAFTLSYFMAPLFTFFPVAQ